jgi:hypothetical protein
MQRNPSQATILWSTEAVSNFRLGPQMPLLQTLVDWTGESELGFFFHSKCQKGNQRSNELRS